jgi:hypothetical protein
VPAACTGTARTADSSDPSLKLLDVIDHRGIEALDCASGVFALFAALTWILPTR